MSLSSVTCGSLIQSTRAGDWVAVGEEGGEAGWGVGVELQCRNEREKWEKERDIGSSQREIERELELENFNT